MSVKAGPATKGKAIHESTPTSVMAKQKFITKPESRHQKVSGMSAAQSILKKHHY